MTQGQRDPVLRLEHARRHLLRLDGLLRDFFKRDPWTVEVTEESGEHVVVLVGARQVPAEVGLTVGDAVNAMRSSLDNLVWQLGLTVAEEPWKRLSWPASQGGEPAVPDNDTRLRGLPDAARELVREMQASVDERWTPLAQLDRLWNDDKHRRLHLLTGYVGSPTGMVVHPPADSPGLFAARYGQTARVGLSEPGDVLLRVPLGYEVSLDWDLTVAFGAGPLAGQPVAEALDALHTFVEDEVLPRFRIFLPHM